MDRLFIFSFAAALLCSTAPALAADVAADGAADQREIVVTGDRIPYGVKVTSTATKTNTDIKDVPQALTIVTSGQIKDQQLRSIADLLNFVPGASYGSGEGNRDQILLRGNSSTA
jgi:catecholate siderophore receptor